MSINGAAVGIQVQQSTNGANHRQQSSWLAQFQADLEAKALGPVPGGKTTTVPVGQAKGPAVVVISAPLQGIDQAGFEKVAQRWPVVGWPVTEQEADAGLRVLAVSLASQGTGGQSQCAGKTVIEAAHAAEARGQGDFSNRQPGLLKQALREQHLLIEAVLLRAGADVLLKQPAEVTAADAEPVGEVSHAARQQGAIINQP